MVRLTIILFFCVSFLAQANAQSKVVQVSTNLGAMKFRLYDDTPKHQNAFIQLTKEGYYDETLFYRVIQNFLIQGGSKSSKNAAPGKRIGYGDPDMTVDDEIRSHYFHKKGSLCAPRQPDDINPFKQSDISQFFIIKGSVYTQGALDTMELAVNRPIRKKVISKIMTPEVRANLKQLKEEKKVKEFREIASELKAKIETEYSLQIGTLEFTEAQRKAYSTVGGYPDLDGKYTIFGECISGFDVIDKIAALNTDKNNRPYTDVKISVTVLNE